MKKRARVVRSLKADNAAGGETVEAVDRKKKSRAKTAKKPLPSLKTITQNKLQKGWPKVMDKMINQAKAGDLPNAILLMKMGGINNENSDEKKKRKGKSFTDVLMGELKKKQKSAEKTAGDKKTDEKKLPAQKAEKVQLLVDEKLPE